MRARHRREKNKVNAVYTKKKKFYLQFFQRKTKWKGKKCETNRNKRGRKIKIFMTNANKSCAAKLHFIRIFYWRLFLIYIKLTIGGAKACETDGTSRSRLMEKARTAEKAYFTRNQENFKFVGSTRFFRYKKRKTLSWQIVRKAKT